MATTFRGSSKSANAPDVKPGLYYGRFEGYQEKVLEQSKFDDEVFVFTFTLLDDDLKALYEPEKEDPITVDKTTSRNLNTKSKTTPGAVKVLKALMTADEYEEFEERAAIDEADTEKLAKFDAKHTGVTDKDLLGRIVQLDVIKKENGWPGIEEVTRTKKQAAK
jgi:hypothetical protein